MAEKVETGGLMSFDYKGREIRKIGEEQKKNIERGYEQYYERKKKERRRRFIIMLIVIVIAGLAAILLS